MTKPPDGAHITYQQQHRRCGKPHCKTCKEGPGHGPYWYGYWRNKSQRKLQSIYFGKTDPRQKETVKA